MSFGVLDDLLLKLFCHGAEFTSMKQNPDEHAGDDGDFLLLSSFDKIFCLFWFFL